MDRGTTETSLETTLGRALISAAAADGLLICRRDGVVEVCNPAAARFLDAPPGTVVGRALQDAYAELDPITGRRFGNALQADVEAEFVVPRPVGADCWTEVRVLPLPDGAAFLLKDVTDRERSERDLRRKEQRLLAANESLRMAHKAVHAASWEWLAGRGLRWLDLPAARQLVGLPPNWTEEEVLADWRDFVVEDDRPAVEDGLAELRRLGEASYEFRVRGADDELHWLQGNAAVVERDAQGAPLRISGVTFDITRVKADEETLKREIAERRRIEQHQSLLLHELNHRVKNILATIQAIARQTFRHRDAGNAIHEFEDRLLALAWTHDVLTEESWISASLGEVLRRTLSPHRDPEGRRIRLQGPEVQISPHLAVALAMAVHELATNAVKYGALSNDAGSVTVGWGVEGRDGCRRLLLDWREQDGPPVEKPHSRGFGSRLIEQGLSRDIGGQVTLLFDRDGVRCHVDAALDDSAVERVPGRDARRRQSQSGDRDGGSPLT